MNCNNECISEGICRHNEECYNDLSFTNEQLKIVEKWLADKRNMTIDEVRKNLNKYRKGINTSNCPFNFINIVLDEMKEQK